jgi:hypothetical protein
MITRVKCILGMVELAIWAPTAGPLPAIRLPFGGMQPDDSPRKMARTFHPRLLSDWLLWQES